MISRVLLCAALVLAADPMEGCRKLRAKAQGKDIAEADTSSQTTGSQTTGVATTYAPGGASAAPRTPNAPPPGDALLTLGTGEWFAYGPDGPRFSVLLPQRPQESMRDVRLGGVAISAKQGTSSRVGVLYTLVFFDLPPSVRLDARATLDAVRDDAIRGLPGAVLRGERQILLGKNPGREFQAESTAQFSMLLTGHIYLVGRRVYEQLITVPSSVGEGTTYVDKFFGSLNAGPDGMGAAMSDQPTAIDTPQPAPDPAPSAKPKKKR
jgi:hypothetical protein